LDPFLAFFWRLFQDGTVMVEAIIDIPLPGQGFACNGAEEKASRAALPLRHFLAGPENCLVHVVVRSVLEEKPNGYNPIVLYGPTGTGKSHLALGLAAEWKARKRRRVECIAAVDFARELGDAIETQAIEEFRTKYREVGLLVFEDIGHLVNRTSEKLSAQDEFIHALDALVERGSWVIVTAANAPSEMAGLLPGLQSRLTAGLTVPLAPPDAHTRLAIINHLAGLREIDLSAPAAQSLAEGLHGAVPELMGALTQLQVPARRNGGQIDEKAVRSLLARRGSEGGPSLHAIALATAKHFGLKLSEIRSPSRQRAVVTARDVAAHLARNMLKCSFEQIGQYFGGRDHTTIMHSWHKMQNLLNTDPAMQHEVEQIEQEIQKITVH
jgi:chromosomal replication initiator protein